MADESPKAISIGARTLITIQQERWRQHAKFGKEPLANVDAAIRIFGEEYGEICKAVNQQRPISEVRKEIVQLAACCIAFLDGDLHDGRQS